MVGRAQLCSLSDSLIRALTKALGMSYRGEGPDEVLKVSLRAVKVYNHH